MPELSNIHCFDVFHLLNDSILVIDQEDNIHFYNDAFLKTFHLKNEDILYKKYQNYINTKLDLKSLKNKNATININKVKHYFNIRTFKHNFANNNSDYILIVFVEGESNIKLKEFKDNLYKEMNEQIKNNLQLIYSLLGLELHYASEQNIIDHKKLISNVQQKIVSMSVVYDMLYKTEDKEIDIAILLTTICNKFYPNLNIKMNTDGEHRYIHKNTLIHFAIGFAEILKPISLIEKSEIYIEIYKQDSIIIDIYSDNIDINTLNAELLSGLMSEVNSSVSIVDTTNSTKLIRIEVNEKNYGKQK